MRNLVTEYIRKCITCAKRRASMHKPVLPAHSLHYDTPFAKLQIDFLEGLGSPQEKDLRKIGHHGKAVAILVIVCAFTRYVKLYPVADKTAETTRLCLTKLFSDMGKADQIVSDGGPAFKSKSLESFLEYFDTSHLVTHPHQPSAHGIVERVNEETRKHLQLLLHKYEYYSYDEWTDILPLVELQLNTTEHSATGYAPCTMIYGTSSVETLRMRALTPATLPTDTDEYVRTLDNNLHAIRLASEEWQDKWAIHRYEKSLEADTVPPLEPGSYVLKNAQLQTPLLKLRMKYEGPYRVIKMLRPDFVRIFDVVNQLEFNDHRRALVPVPCDSDDTARKYFAKDMKELFVDKILSHTGDSNKIKSLKFQCTCTGIRLPLTFEFDALRLLPQFKTYLQSCTDLNKAHLLARTHDTGTQRRAPKKTYSQSGMFDNN